MSACCQQGGCCNPTPAKIELQNDTPVRVNIAIRASGCCGPPPAACINPEDNTTVPAPLLEKNLRADKWQAEISKLQDINLKRHTCCQDFGACLISAMTCCIFRNFCKEHMQHDLEIDADLREWQEQMNQHVMEPLGLFIKTKSHCTAIYTDKGKRRVFHYWLAIALTPEEAAKLRTEPHLTGDVQDLSCCGGLNENQLCMHPPH